MMFVNELTDGTGDHLHQYSLNKSFDLSGGANFIRSADLETQIAAEGQARGIAFNQNGTRLFMVGSFKNQINQYTLSEGFNISTASFDGGVNRSTNPNGIDFSPDGLRMFILDTRLDLVQEHHLPCPFNSFCWKMSIDY